MYAAIAACLVYLSLVSSQLLKVQPPNIILPNAEGLRYVKEKFKVTIPCVAKGNPKPTYSWLRNNEDVRPGGTFIEYDEVTGNLTIPSFSSREEGEFVCIAKNVINNIVIKTMSPKTKLTLISIGQFDKITTEDVTGHPGDPLTLNCEGAPKSEPPGQFKWYIGRTSSSEMQLDHRQFIDDKGSLHFAYVKSEDQREEPYRCAVANALQGTIILGKMKSLKVASINTPLPQSKPKVQYHTTEAKGILRGKTTLECFFSGNPVPVGDSPDGGDIDWFDAAGKKIIPSASSGKYSWGSSHKRVLEIFDLVEEDEGVYQCAGSNSLGSANADIFLNVTSPPIVVEGLHSQTVTQGKDAEFTCITRAASGETEPPPPTWYKNGELWTSKNPDKYVLSDKDRRLTVKNVNKQEDISCFQCRVENDIGSIFGDGCLNVILPITVTTRPPETQEITKGDVVNLTVKATTEEGLKIQYSWFFNGAKVNDTRRRYITYDPDTLEAYINTSALTDEEYKTINGTYIRKVSHTYDTVNVTTMVILKELPGAVAVVAAQTDLWWIALIIAIILLIVVVVIICIVCRRKQQEGVYPLDKKERAADLDPEKDLADSGFHDLSRADADDDYPSKPKINPDSLDDDQFSDNEDDASLMEYGGDIDPGKFNEDGSFIGQYAPRKPPPPVSYQPNEVGTKIGTKVGHSEV